MRIPVKLPGPVIIPIAVISRQVAPHPPRALPDRDVPHAVSQVTGAQIRRFHLHIQVRKYVIRRFVVRRGHFQFHAQRRSHFPGDAQDALAVVDTWLRKGEEPTDEQILTMNVNGDSRINTFDALGIVEKFVNGSEYAVVIKAATITTKQ